VDNTFLTVWAGSVSVFFDRPITGCGAPYDPLGGGLKPVAKLLSLSGSVTVVRAGAALPAPAAGPALYQGDIIETAPGASAELLFLDGSTFHLQTNSRLVVDQFPSADSAPAELARLRIARGAVGFFP